MEIWNSFMNMNNNKYRKRYDRKNKLLLKKMMVNEKERKNERKWLAMCLCNLMGIAMEGIRSVNWVKLPVNQYLLKDEQRGQVNHEHKEDRSIMITYVILYLFVIKKLLNDISSSLRVNY